MTRLISASISCALLASLSAVSAFAEDVSSASICAEWKSGVAVNLSALDKLARNSAGDKPEKGLAYTQDQLIVLLGKNPVEAKNVLATSKNKLPKSGEGRVDLKGTVLNGFNLSGLSLDNVDFRGAEMNGVDLSGSSLRGSLFNKAELEGANLNNANLTGAYLTKAKLVNASLCQTTLNRTDLEDAEIVGAYMKGAKLDMARNIPKVLYLNADSVLRLGMPVPVLKE